jgi:hypothetical protein
MGLDPYSQVYRLDDKGRTRKQAKFRTVVRRGVIADRATLAFAELHWADLSRVGQSALARLLTVLQLFFEAPQVLGASMLVGSDKGMGAMIRRLILWSVWLLRWPIAGMTMTLFLVSFGMMGLDRLVLNGLVEMPKLNAAVGGLLAATTAAGLALAYFRYRHDIALTDLGLSTAMFSLLMLAGLVATSWLKLASAGDLEDRAAYLATIGNIIIGSFALWNVTVVASFALMLLMWLGARLGNKAAQRYPLHRAATAAGLSVAQGMLWKLFVCPLSLFIVFVHVERRGGTFCSGDNCAWAMESLSRIVKSLVIVAVTNAIMTALVVIAIAAVVAIRAIKLRWDKAALMTAESALPRLIASPLLLIALFVGQFSSAATFYYAQYWPWIARWLNDNLLDDRTIAGLQGFLTSATLISVVPYILGVVSKASGGVVHVARDLVDHQYAPRYVVAKFRLPEWLQQRGRYPRRERIQKRLEALMEGILGSETFDRLVFLTHSQGTVITYDYLRSVRDNAMPGHIGRIDVITLASPLSHLYQHYFRAYQEHAGTAAALNPKLRSWTNLWRIDDPIGGKLDIVAGDMVRNEPLGSGGHVNYWREDRVCEVILDVIDPAPDAAARVRTAEMARRGRAARKGKVVLDP